MEALGADGHIVTVMAVGGSVRYSAILELRYKGFLKSGPRLVSPYHDSYKLTMAGLKAARQLVGKM